MSPFRTELEEDLGYNSSTQSLFCNCHIDPMHKWLPIKNSLVSIKISPTNLVF